MSGPQTPYGDAREVAKNLAGEDKVDIYQLALNLLDALTRVDRLEGQVFALRREVESLCRDAPPAIGPVG